MRWFNLSGGGSPTETRQYNSLGQMTRLTIPGQIDREYRFSATANDGKATPQKNYLSGEELEFQYGSLGRLASAETIVNSGSASQWGLSWVFDGFGNRLQQNAVKGTVPTRARLVDPTTNRVQSHSFDANGNTPNTPAQGNMTFDVMDRLKTVASDTYGYTPSNQRQWKNSDFTLWGADGVRVVTAQVATIGSDLRFTQLAFDSYSHGRRLQVTDRLGSVGNYFPYGDAKSGTVSNADSFATYYRDSTGLDYAQQRYYQPASGRFLTTDPKQSSADSAVPESWHRYSYSLDDPSNRSDPQGLASSVVTSCFAVYMVGSFCSSTVTSPSGKTFQGVGFVNFWNGNSISQQTATAKEMSVSNANLSGGWQLTSELIGEAIDTITKQGISSECRGLIDKIGTLSTLSNATILGRLSSVRFLDSSTLVSGIDAVQDLAKYAFETVPGVYAFAEYGNLQKPNPRVWWLPGANGQTRQANWLLGAVFHEAVLHGIGLYDDVEIQSAFGLTVNAFQTDNITVTLAETCFKVKE